MPNVRLSMRKTKELFRLYFESGLSQRNVALSCGVSRPTVCEYLRRFKAAGLTWPLREDFDDRQLESLLFRLPARLSTAQRPQPDFVRIHSDLKKKGVTLALLWEEYMQSHSDGYSYAQYCALYRSWRGKLSISMRQEHKAGEKVFSDFAGTTIPIVVDSRTGDVRLAHLFVSALGASHYTYVEWFFSEDARAWCTGQARAFIYFGGCPEIVVPDNPRATVNKPCRYEPDINPDFHHMSSYHKVAVIPARVRHPKDKAVAESAVGVATKWIIGVLNHSNRIFYSLHELNQATRELLEHLNTKPFKKLPGNRRSLFEQIDQPTLKPLPSTPYQYTQIRRARVNVDYHIDVEGHWYSVPYQLLRHQVDVLVSLNTIEIFFKGRRVASHVRSFVKGRHTTLNEHRPKAHQQYLEWTPTRIVNWASKIGPDTAKLVAAIMESRPHPEQGFRSCLGIIRLGRAFGDQRLEAACCRALTIGAYSYKSVKSILESGLDRHPAISADVPLQLSIIHSNIRGPQYFSYNKEVVHVDSPDHTKLEDNEALRHGESTGNTDGNARH